MFGRDRAVCKVSLFCSFWRGGACGLRRLTRVSYVGVMSRPLKPNRIPDSHAIFFLADGRS